LEACGSEFATSIANQMMPAAHSSAIQRLLKTELDRIGIMRPIVAEAA